MKIKVLAGIIVLALMGSGYYFFTGQFGVTPALAQAPKRPPVEVEVYTVAPQQVTLTQDLPGRTSSWQIAEIRPQVTGIIVERLFTEGSFVKAGQQLYQIDPAQYKAAFDSSKAALRKAEANITAVEPKMKRYRELVEVGGVSRQSYDDVVASLAQAKADVAVAQAAVATAKINLNYTKVFAPISGQIGKSSVTKGALVTANQGTALATVQNLTKIYVDVSQSSAAMMKLRKPVSSGEQTGNMEAELIVDKSKNRLYVYHNSGPGLSPELVDDFYVVLGKNTGEKFREGDLKTPDGVYFVTSYLPDEKLPPLYGSGAFPVNYPNEYDHRLQKTGKGIWLHGTDKSLYSRPPLDSEGCVVLTNEEFTRIGQYVEIGRTPIIISESVDWISSREWLDQNIEVQAALETWRQNWERSDLTSYLDMYADDFWSKKYDKMGWAAYKKQVFSSSVRLGSCI